MKDQTVLRKWVEQFKIIDMVVRPCHLIDITERPSRLVSAEIVFDFELVRLDAIEESWTPSRKRLAEILLREGIDIEHENWNWSNKKDSPELRRIVALDCEKATQGLMALQQKGHPSRERSNRELLYVDFVESAPWNITRIDELRRYAPIGKMLLSVAIQMSNESGYEGAIGLHSLRLASRFYRHVGMTSFGNDSSCFEMEYFEFSPAQSENWLKEFTNELG